MCEFKERGKYRMKEGERSVERLKSVCESEKKERDREKDAVVSKE